MNFVIDLFKKMGPRYVVIKRMGKLIGLITKKDVLDAIEEQELLSGNTGILPSASDADLSNLDDIPLSPELRRRY
jgi:hypothetical protein